MYYCSFVSNEYTVCECGDAFETEELLKEHLEKENHNTIPKPKEEIEEITTYQCSLCSTIFRTKRACAIHIEKVHIITKQNQKQAEQKEKSNRHVEKNIVCEVCGKRYASNAALGYHQRVHTGERPYKCMFCPKTFTMPLFLQSHVRIHTDERPYQCPLCPKAFRNKAALLRHDRVHTGAKPYGCEQCGKFFTQSNSLKLHIRTVHLKQPAPYKSKNRRLKEMMRFEARKEVRLEKSQLDRLKAEPQELEEMEEVDDFKTGVNAYGCEHCGKFFTQSSSLEQHIRTAHLKDWMTLEVRQDDELEDQEELKMEPQELEEPEQVEVFKIDNDLQTSDDHIYTFIAAKDYDVKNEIILPEHSNEEIVCVYEDIIYDEGILEQDM